MKLAIPAAAAALSAATTAAAASLEPLYSLGGDLCRARLLQRPSALNRSPYVADIELLSSGRRAICHVPSLDMGGKCVAGAELLVQALRDKKGELVGPDAVSPKYGTPKCEFSLKLLRVDETDLGGPSLWIGAHPSIGEKIAEALLRRGLLAPQMPAAQEILREVRNPAGCDMRADFVLRPEGDGRRRVVEVKTVVDSDYAADRAPERDHCVFVSHEKPYRRAGIFPWGSARQKGPDGETVVSARAIKHVDNLRDLATGARTEQGGERLDAAVLFIVVRDDCVTFRPNAEACPSFAQHLADAAAAGVDVLAARVRWGEDAAELGSCYFDGLIPVALPSADWIAQCRAQLPRSPKKAPKRRRKEEPED